MSEEVRTRRLVGARPQPSDADELHPVCADERLSRWLWPAPLTPAQTRSALVKDAAHWDRHGFGRWIWRQEGVLVAHAGLLVASDDGVELAWYVAPGRWREGFARETAHAAIREAFDALDLPAVTAKTLPDNAASVAVMRSLGMRFDGELEHAGRRHVRYRLAQPVR